MPLKKRDFQFEEPKKYKKYSPSENSFKYPMEEKWTIDKIEQLNNQFLNKAVNALLILFFIVPVPVSIIAAIACSGDYDCSCPHGRYSRSRGSCDPQDW